MQARDANTTEVDDAKIDRSRTRAANSPLTGWPSFTCSRSMPARRFASPTSPLSFQMSSHGLIRVAGSAFTLNRPPGTTTLLNSVHAAVGGPFSLFALAPGYIRLSWLCLTREIRRAATKYDDRMRANKWAERARKNTNASTDIRPATVLHARHQLEPRIPKLQ
ncbi:unnamed protein product [Rhizoctonia solani]|uniref:Uncharacterized protein n=1 Tax=Rhizoctonia solani TaxID=456999 RepID=A0A8H3I1E8_9AGAM|nr:unnamed protein product [Rhizoctonia solani]